MIVNDMIVKVQVAIVTSANAPRVLIYNEDRSASYEGRLDLVAGADALSDEPKQFWNAHINVEADGRSTFTLTSPADWQDW